MKMSNLKDFIVETPVEMNPIFAAAFNSGRVENLLALYEPNAVLITQSGESLSGLPAIKAELSKLLALGGEMISENIYAYQNEEIALLRARFILKTKKSNGEPLEITGHTSEIVRRQKDGRWLYIVDHPFGANG